MEKILEDFADQIRYHKLEELGWQFMMTGPNEFQWLKFIGENCIAQQFDAVWKADHENL